ncbi:MAG: DUF3987 domain-containing protein, partial [Phycisphaerae bacterium]|nr:DUF3987 domain-containing protein [Phycisphaerae bacterium]
RGAGGLILCAPTAGYEVAQGDLADLPVLTADQRDTLLSAAWALNEYASPQAPTAARSAATGQRGADTGRPGDDYNARGDVRALLEAHGWVRTRAGANEHWCRPGKARGTSATLKDGVFHVFSSNAAPFEPDGSYAPFAVYALLEHAGDYEQAARALRAEGYGGDAADDGDVDISAIADPGVAEGEKRPATADPGPMPAELLRVPGFVSEVMDHCLAAAPYPSPVMAFAGAISLQAFLAGRKVRDPGDNRTNVYLLGLAHSGAGKNFPREINTEIVHRIGLADCLGQSFASGEGIQDALFLTPCMLFQTDEIDGMLQSINKAKDARHEAVLNTLLTMFSASNSVFPMRRKAGKESPGVIDQPHLVIFGTAIPNHYYEALSERMLTNGFFARMIILESGPRPTGQEPGLRNVPERVLATARHWAEMRPGEGDLQNWHPVPKVVEHSEEARSLLVENRREAEAEYAKAEQAADPVGTTVWGRLSEQVRKLALLYAVSENHSAPRIGVEAVRWASRFMMHQTRRMLFMAASHVADNPFQADCLKLLQKLRDAPDRELSHSVLLKRMKMKTKDFKELVDTLVQRGEVEVLTAPRSGWPVRTYRLVEGETRQGGET